MSEPSPSMLLARVKVLLSAQSPAIGVESVWQGFLHQVSHSN